MNSFAIQPEVKPEKSTDRNYPETRPKILHLLNSFIYGGTERQATELLKRIDLDRYEISLAVLKMEGTLYRQIADRYPDVPEFRLTSFYNLNALRQYKRLRELLVRRQIDLVHAHDFYSSIIGAISGRLAGVPVIVSQRHLKLSDRRLHDWGQRFINLAGNRVLVNSEAIRTRILSTSDVSPEKIIVIRNGFISGEDECGHIGPGEDSGSSPREEICREFGISREARLVGMVARMEEVKGHRFFVEAAAQVAGEHPDAHFLLVGDGELRKTIEEQASNLGLDGRLHLLGYRENASRIASAFDLAVLSSLHEGLPNTVLEAMVSGVPVVATATGGTTELITDGKTGYLVPPADSDALARRISWALSNMHEIGKVAERARQYAHSNFSMSRMVSSIEQLYNEMTGEKVRSSCSDTFQIHSISLLISQVFGIAGIV